MEITSYLPREEIQQQLSDHCLIRMAFWNRLSAGLNLSTAIQTAFGDPVWGVGMDLGLTYRLIRDPILGDHLLGLSTQNLIAPRMKGETDEAGAGKFFKRYEIQLAWKILGKSIGKCSGF